jgi:hypothetical protein
MTDSLLVREERMEKRMRRLRMRRLRMRRLRMRRLKKRRLRKRRLRMQHGWHRQQDQLPDCDVHLIFMWLISVYLMSLL